MKVFSNPERIRFRGFPSRRRNDENVFVSWSYCERSANFIMLVFGVTGAE
jgi:hypothetical protein